MNRLLFHDVQIAAYHLRAAFPNLRDSLTTLAAASFVVGLARYSLFSFQPLYRPIMVAIAASVIAPYLYFVLLRRIIFFRSNSVVADVALDAAQARLYVFCVITIACMAILIALLSPELSLMFDFILSFCASLLIAVILAKSLDVLHRRISSHRQRRLDELLASRYLGKGMPLAAVGGAAIVFIVACLLPAPPAASIAAFTSIVLGFWFSPIAYSAVEYERLIGLSATYSMRVRLREAVLLAGALTGGALVSLHWQVAAIVAAVFVLLVLYKALEVLMVRAVGEGKAQIWMLLFLFGIVSMAFAVPFLIPLLVLVSAWRLLAKARGRTWQLA